MTPTFTALVLAASLSAASAPRTHRVAPEDALTEPVRHSEGFVLRVDLGAAFTNATTPREDLDPAARGAAGELGLLLGKVISQNLVLAVHGWGLAGPALTNDSNVTLVGFGPNLTTHLMPADVFVSITPSVTVLSLGQAGGVEPQMEWGFGGHVAAGKEWPLQGRWGLALMAFFAFAVNGEQAPHQQTWNTANAGVAIAATFN